MIMAEKESQNQNASKILGPYTVFLTEPVIANDDQCSVYFANKPETKYDKLACKIIPLSGLEEDSNKLKDIETKLFQNDYNNTIVAKLSGFSQTKTNLYIFMQYYKEGSLQNLLEKSYFFLPEERILNLMYQILVGYYSIYQKSYSLGDFKPENILLRKGKPRICAFGINRKITLSNKLNVKEQSILSCRSPQRILGEVFTPKTEIYTLGVIFYFMLYGSYPINVSSISSIESASQAFQDLQRLGPENAVKFPVRPDGTKPSSMTVQAIRRMLEYAEKDRISIEQLLHHLAFKNVPKKHSQSENLTSIINPETICTSKVYFHSIFELCQSLKMIIEDLRQMNEYVFVGTVGCDKDVMSDFSVNLVYLFYGSVKFCKRAMKACKKPQDGVPFDPAFFASKEFFELYTKVISLKAESKNNFNDYLYALPPQHSFSKHNFSTGAIFQRIKMIYEDCIQPFIENTLKTDYAKIQEVKPIYLFFKQLFSSKSFNLEQASEMSSYKQLKSKKFDRLLV